MLCPRRYVWILVCLSAALGGCDRRPATDKSGAASVKGNDGASSAGDSTQSAANTGRGDSENLLRPDDWFEDVTDRTGVRFTVHNGRESKRLFMIEGLGGGGVAMLDFDSDGDIDLFFTGGGTIPTGESLGMVGQLPALFRNVAEWQFVDVTVAAGLAEPLDYSQGCAVTDYNIDGFPDLIVCCFGRSRIYRNLGDGTFTDAGDVLPTPPQSWGTTAACGDVDHDGLPDLFLLRYADWSPERNMPCYSPDGIADVCSPRLYTGTTPLFFHNLGDGTFEDWSERMGIKGNVFGLGILATDLNGDGWVDFYIGSDSTPNHLYLGGQGIHFTEVAAEAGVSVAANGQPQGSMGVDAADYDGDGLLDLWVVNFDKEDDSLYHNLGDCSFEYATFPTGLAGHTRMRSGFGTSLADFDGDGWPDIFIFNGNPLYEIASSPWKQPPQLFRNKEGRRFQNISEQGGTFFREVYSGRGSATGDLDDDGAPDIAAAPIDDPVRILRNRLTPKNYVKVELRARQGEPDATGARITANFNGRKLTRFVVRGAGYFSQSDPRIIFPVDPEADVAEVVVEWPGRGHERFRSLSVRYSHLLVEGRGESLP